MSQPDSPPEKPWAMTSAEALGYCRVFLWDNSCPASPVQFLQGIRAAQLRMANTYPLMTAAVWDKAHNSRFAFRRRGLQLRPPLASRIKRAEMRAVIQRVSEAKVTIGGHIKGAIQHGLVVLLAIEPADTAEDIEWLSGKIVRLRIFDDEHGVMNRSVQDVQGDILLVSQFTLFASTKKGNRPSYSRSATPEIAVPLYQAFVTRLAHDLGRPVQTGEFGAQMVVSLANDGPVTIIIDSKDRE